MSVSSGGRRIRAPSSRGIHAAAMRSTCCPAYTVSLGTRTVSATRSSRRETGGGALSSNDRAKGLSVAVVRSAALSTVMRIGSVETTLSPWRARTGPMSNAPACCARSCSSRTVVRIDPPAPLNATSVMSREPSMAKPLSVGNMIWTGSAARLRARIVNKSCSPTRRRVRSTLAVTSAPCSSARADSRCSITSL